MYAIKTALCYGARLLIAALLHTAHADCCVDLAGVVIDRCKEIKKDSIATRKDRIPGQVVRCKQRCRDSIDRCKRRCSDFDPVCRSACELQRPICNGECELSRATLNIACEAHRTEMLHVSCAARYRRCFAGAASQVP